MKKGPYIRSQNTTAKMMQNLAIALFPIVLFNFYKNGYLPYQKGYLSVYGLCKPILFPIIGILIGPFLEYLIYQYCYGLTKEEAKEKCKHAYASFPGLFLSLILPVHTPLWVFLLGCVFATFIGKMLYGGFGRNIFNPALIGALFILTFFGAAIASNGGYLNDLEVDTIASSTPLSLASQTEGIGTYQTLVEPYGNLLHFFFGMIPGAMGETCTVLCIIAYFYLSYKHVIKWKIPLLYIGTVFMMTLLIGRMNGVGLWYPAFHIFSGGLFFGAVFMATDPVTSPITSIGQCLYAILLGVLTVYFRLSTPLPEGVLTSILTMNVFVILLDRIGASEGNLLKRIPIFFTIVLAVGVSFFLARDFQTEKTDQNFQILEKIEKEEGTIYRVSQKGNGGPIKSELTVKDGVVIKFQVLEQHETEAYYQKINEEAYLKALLQGQHHLEEVDTIAGATISSSALKKTIENVLKDVEVKP